jgi:hypothetical protein
MTKSELRTMIKEMLQEELNKKTFLAEAVAGPTYVIKAWERPGKQGNSIDTSKTGEKYPDFDDVIKALQTKYDGLGVYEITWIPAGSKAE